MGYFQEYIMRWKTGQAGVSGKKDPDLYVRHVEDTAGFTSIQSPGEGTSITFTSGAAARLTLADEMCIEAGRVPSGWTH